jgi:glycosyltransferase involved in cell wall biosynthesis
MERTRKRICWITPDYFLCVDPYIVPHLINEFDIEWILINTYGTKRKVDGLVSDTFKPKEFNLQFRQKDPRIICQYIKFINKIRKLKVDLIYNSFHGFPFFLPLLLKFINPNKIIWAVHNVRTPKGASNEKWMDTYQNYLYKRFRNFHVFSEYQLRIIKEIIPEKNHYYAPLALEDYGTSNVLPPNDVIRFLFFGYIKRYKRLDLLIHSFRELRKSGIDNIELLIAGNCENWDYYESIIAKDSGIKTKIEIIPNREIPDLVSSCHYMVLPYKDGAQSAVLTLAYQYNKPVIVSDIESFKQFVIDGSTGFFFKNESQESLTNIMKKVVSEHDDNYQKLKGNIKSFVEKEFSINEVLIKYRNFLNDSIKNQT